MTIRDYIDCAVKNNPDSPSQKFFSKGQWVTRSYRELQNLVVRGTSILRRLGVEPGQHVIALMLENCPEWEVIYLSLVSVGCTVVPMDPKFKEREVHHILKDSEATGIVIGAKQQEVLKAVLSQNLPSLRACVVVGDAATKGYPNDFAVFEYETLLAQVKDDDVAQCWYANHKPTESTIASLIYTSGTTGAPKGAILTHGNFTSNAASAVQCENFQSDDTFLVALPLFHAFSFSFSFILALACGGCGCFIRSLRTISEDIKILQPTTILAVPLMAEKMYAKIESKLQTSRTARFLRSVGLGFIVARGVRKGLGGNLRRMAIGGAPTSQNVLKGFAKFGIPAKEGYGLTECSPLVSWPSIGSSYEIGSVGQILPCMEVKVDSPDETGAGELCVKGPNVTQGYYRNPEATKASFDEDGFFHTGDVVRLNHAGSLFICGRRKALIVNREGKNIYPEEVEQAVCRCAYVAESLSLGYTIQGEVGEHVGLIVQPNDEVCEKLGETQEARDASLRNILMKLCREHLADYKIPRKFVFRHEAFSLTSTMKVRRAAYSGSLNE